jgi:hypothetical protein
MPGGRPSKLTPEIAARVVEAVEAGASLRVAAAHGGIAQSTLFLWLARGEEEGAPREFSEFSERVGAARSGLFVRLGQAAIAGAMNDPRLALSSMRALFAADLDPPRLGVEVSGSLAVHHDDPGLAALLLDPEWCERTQAVLATAPGLVDENGARPPLHRNP